MGGSWSGVPKSCGGVSVSLNLPLKAAKITNDLYCRSHSARSNFLLLTHLGVSPRLVKTLRPFSSLTCLHPGFWPIYPNDYWEFIAWVNHLIFFICGLSQHFTVSLTFSWCFWAYDLGMVLRIQEKEEYFITRYWSAYFLCLCN